MPLRIYLDVRVSWHSNQRSLVKSAPIPPPVDFYFPPCSEWVPGLKLGEGEAWMEIATQPQIAMVQNGTANNVHPFACIEFGTQLNLSGINLLQ